jgi:hypothetical protein
MQWDLTQPYSTGVVTVTGSTTAAGMQLGPNNKIYVSTAGTGSTTTAVGVVANPNSVGAAACGYTNAGLTLSGTGVAIGLASISWLNPQYLKPKIDTVGTIGNCTDKTFSIDFPNYFGDQIAQQNATILWDWGHGGLTTTANNNPSHTFPNTGGPYTVTLSYKDTDGCQTWTNTISIPIVCPAPVELLNFNAIAKDGGVLVSWQTAMELNNDHFDLQRSFDGVHFESVANIKGAGNNSSTLSYKYKDMEVSSGLVYYRLDQYDYDGTKTSSKIIPVQLGKDHGDPFIVAPNPFNTSFVVSKLYDEAATISVYDVLGRLLEQKYSGPEERVLVLGEELSNGSYLIKYISGTNTYTLHIEKK